MYLRRRLRVKNEGERRSIFLRYLGEVATAVETITGADREKLYEQLVAVAKKKTAEADVQLDESGKPIIEEEAEDFGSNVLIVAPTDEPAQSPAAAESDTSTSKRKSKRRKGIETTDGE
jgi:DNA topoisomerase-6 subunit B